MLVMFVNFTNTKPMPEMFNLRKKSKLKVDRISFPDSKEDVGGILPRLGDVKCADGLTYCENFDKYPYDRVQNILQHKPVHKELFGYDEEPTAFVHRMEEFDEHFVCKATTRTIFPTVGKNTNNQWKFIINQKKDGYIQGVRVETCRFPGKRCDILSELPSGYVTACKQKYVYRRLISLSDNGEPAMDTFIMPSACCCSYKKDLDFLSRIGMKKKR
ncbi:unnamed protein product [Brassicogethes aeneus]|uniref:Spaetzle domain-containing protein n=1 Tax=Brassicogethes aeneus TaxID=1431903 RepID=A0A9P0AW37_BRAAE|nr:unnamed protein product [Brassicogethes aeneus]